MPVYNDGTVLLLWVRNLVRIQRVLKFCGCGRVWFCDGITTLEKHT